MRVLRRHVMILAAAVLVGTPALVLLSRSGTPPPLPPTTPEALRRHLIRPDSHATGNLYAAITVVEFGDIQCPACKNAEATAKEIRQIYGDRIRFVFRHFPIKRLHPFAEKAAVATECAAMQGKFWQALDRFYQNRDDLSEPALLRYATELGLDPERFQRCLGSAEAAERVRQDVADALALGVKATPTFIIGNVFVEGAIPLADFARLLDQQLARVGGSPDTFAQLPLNPTSSGTAVGSPLPSTNAAPGAGSSFGSMGQFGNPGTGAFTQFQGTATTCREEQTGEQQPTLIGTIEARRYFESGSKFVFVDVRPTREFRAEHIPGAINIPAEEIEKRLESLPRNSGIVLYESGRAPGDACAASRAAGRALLARGFPTEHVKVYEDGLAGWQKAGLPIRR
jgi:rhodanese-related sulfurtransferase